MHATTETKAPSVWIGCLECYNAGRLVGDWYPAIEARDVTTDQIHGKKARPNTHEELWVFDCKDMLVDEEMCPSDATI